MPITTNRNSVPEEGEEVKRKREEVLRIANLIADLWNEHARMDVEYKMKIGDMIRSMQKYEKQLCKVVMEKRFGVGLYAKFRECGWIAKRWADPKRRAEEMEKRRPWSFYRDHGPDSETLYEPRKKPSFMLCSGPVEYKDGDGVYFMSHTNNDHEVTARVPDDVFDEAYELRKKKRGY